MALDEVEEKVLVYDTRIGRWSKNATVVSTTESGSCRVRMGGGGLLRPARIHLRPCYPPLFGDSRESSNGAEVITGESSRRADDDTTTPSDDDNEVNAAEADTGPRRGTRTRKQTKRLIALSLHPLAGEIITNLGQSKWAIGIRVVI